MCGCRCVGGGLGLVEDQMPYLGLTSLTKLVDAFGKLNE